MLGPSTGLQDLLTTGNLNPEAETGGLELVTTSGSGELEGSSGMSRTPSLLTLTLSASLPAGGETPLSPAVEGGGELLMLSV